MAADMIARGMANSAQKRADSAYDLAAGRALALSVTNIQKLVSDFNTASNTYAKVGDNIYIQQLNVPDFWVFKVDTTRADYTYTTDQAFLQAIARNGYVKVGYFQISQLESKHQVTFGYYYGNQFYYNAGHTDQIIPDENGMFFDIPTKDGYVYRDGAYTQIINSTEETERKREDEALGGRIDAEETARESADTQLTNDLAAEAQARAAADGTLQDNIDTEATARAMADETLIGEIGNEEAARIAADTAIRTWTQQQITEKIDNSLYKIEFTISATIWQRGIKGIRYLPKITFGDNISLDMERLLILRSNDPKFVEHEVRLVGQGNENGCGYILIDCDYYSKGSPTFPNEDIDCVLYVITLNTKNTIKTNGYVELEDEDWLNIDIQQIGDTVEINEVSVRLSGNELEVI